MKAITIRPPWSQIIAETAALEALGVEPKRVENRGQPVAAKHIGQDIAIHAGKTWCEDGEQDPRVQWAWQAFGAAIHTERPNPRLDAIGDHRTGCVGSLRPSGLWMPEGAVVAVATLVDCHPAAYGGAPGKTCCAPWGEAFHNGGPCFHLQLANVRRLRHPVPARGMQAVPFTLPPDVTAEVTSQLTKEHL